MNDFADFHIDGPFADGNRLTYVGTALRVTGWAILPAENYRLAVYAGEQWLGCITPSGSRADLLIAFPSLAKESTPGFTTSITLPRGLAEANPDLQIRIAIERDGKVVKENRWGLTKGLPWLEFNIDEARVVDGKLVCDQRNLRFYGWATCQEAISGISADLGENESMTVQFGITRSDAFAVHPDNPNGANIGFSLFIAQLPPDCDSITFSVLLKTGAVLTRRFELSVEVEPESIPRFRSLAFAESYFLTRKTDRLVSRPCFVILPNESSSTPAVEPTSESVDLPEQAHNDTSSTLASILANNSANIQPVILIHADCTPLSVAAMSARIDKFRDGADLSRAMQDLENEWVICLRDGDTVSANLALFLSSRQWADKSFIYWDETVATGTRARTLHKVPGAPFLTLLHYNFIGRGWAARITDEMLTSLTDGNPGEYMLSVPLTAFQIPTACAHIPELLSRHIYASSQHELTGQEIAARNHVLKRVDSIYGPLSFAPNASGAVPAGHLVLRCEDSDLPRISVIIPTIGTARRILECLRGLRERTDYPNLEIVVIDHMPFKPEFLGLKRQVREYADRVLPMIGPFNWSRFNNAGAALATGDVFLFLNDDVEMLDPQWLRRLLPYLSQDPVGAVGPRLLTAQGTIQSCGVSLIDGEGAARNDYAFTDAEARIGDGINLVPRNCSSLLGAAILTRRNVFAEMGGFEEALPLTFNDLDYHMKLRAAGRQVAIVPTSSLVHFEKTSRALIEEKTLEEIYDRKWRRQHLLGDPYIHPACETESGMYKIHREPGEILWNRNISALREDVRSILVMRLDHIGDFTLTVPAFRQLRRDFPNAHIHAVVGPWNQALARHLNVFDEVTSFNFYNERSGDGRELDENASRQKFRELMRGQDYDLAIDMRLDGDTRLLLTLVEARFRAGFSQGLLHPWLDISLEWSGNLRSWRKNNSVADDMRLLIMTVADRFPSAVPQAEDHWHPEAAMPPQGDTDSAGALATITGSIRPRRVIIHPFAGNEIKMWPDVKWRDLVHLLHEDGITVLLIGSAQDAIRMADMVEALVQAGAVNAAGAHSLDELLPLIAGADCLVGCDSGPKHLAASVGIPVVGLQSGFVDPVMWGPMNLHGVSLIRNVRCAPCYIDDATLCPRKVACMTQISVADVYRQVHRALDLSDPQFSAQWDTLWEPWVRQVSPPTDPSSSPVDLTAAAFPPLAVVTPLAEDARPAKRQKQ